jgi:hypothetical protein
MRSTAGSMPAVVPVAPASTPPPVVHAPAPVPAPTPVAHAPAYEPITTRQPAVTPAMSAHVSSVVDQKVAAISAKGPEYEALAKLSREIIEQIVWEIVPELAEVIIREQVAKRG